MNSKFSFIDSGGVVQENVELKITTESIEITKNREDSEIQKYVADLKQLFIIEEKNVNARATRKAFSIFSKEQKQEILEHVLGNVIANELAVININEALVRQGRKITEMQDEIAGLRVKNTDLYQSLQRISDFSQKATTQLNSVIKQVSELTVQKTNTLEQTVPKAEIDSIISSGQTTKAQIDYIQYDLGNIKRTLNIMIELWEEGTDFKTVLLKARTKKILQYGASYSDCLQIENYNLIYDNMGNPINNGNNLFQRLI